MSEEVLVEVKEISRYYGSLTALKNISFSMRKGEILGLLGPNGAGKTTTMQILTGNLAPSTGSIRIAGHDLLENPKEAKSAIGYLPELPPVYRDQTVDEYLDYVAALNRIAKKDRLSARNSAKEKCGLSDVGGRLIGHLSKGYQQRVGIAQAIIHLPPVVVFDEPTVGLDPLQIREIRELIIELGKEHSVILSSHNLPEIQLTCSRVQIINKGELVFSDSIDGLQQQLKGNSITCKFSNQPDPAALKSIAGIKSVVREKGDYLRIVYDGDDPTDKIVKRSVKDNWGLRELRPGRVSLEQVFMELTTIDDAEEQ